MSSETPSVLPAPKSATKSEPEKAPEKLFQVQAIAQFRFRTLHVASGAVLNVTEAERATLLEQGLAIAVVSVPNPN